MSHLKIFNFLQKSLWKPCLSFHMLKHSILDILMLRSTPLIHLNYLYYALWYLPYVCTDSYSCCLRAQVMVPFISSNVSLTVLTAISCKNVNLFCSVSDTTCVFCLNRIPFHYFSANSIDILFHRAAQYHRSRCLRMGSAKKGNLNPYEGNLIFTRRLPDGQPKYSRSC